MKAWSALFQPHILERGREYYLDGLVDELIADGNQVTAVVTGSEEYDVEISLTDGEATEMYCSCPYAERGENCKHMAAVLFALEKEKMTAASGNMRSEAEKLVASISESMLRELLVEQAMKDDFLFRRLKAEQNRQGHKLSMENLFEEAVRIVEDHQNDYDPDEDDLWEETCAECEGELIALLEYCIWPLLDEGKEKEVFDLTVRIAAYLGKEADDYDALGAWMDLCADRWRDMLQDGTEDERVRRFERLMKLWELTDNLRLEEALKCENFKEEFLRRKLKIYQKEIDQASRQGDLDSYLSARMLREALRTMHELEESEAELVAFYEKYMDYSEVRRDAAEHAKALGQYNEAIRIMKEGMTDKNSDDQLKAEFGRELIALYDQFGREEEYRTALKEYIWTQPQQDLFYIWRLKGLQEWDEWEKTRETIFGLKSCRTIRLELMEDEQLYGRLEQEVTGSDSIEIMLKYDQALRPLYNSRLKEAWFQLLDRRMSAPTDRGTYREIIRLLKQLASYPEGDEAVRQLVAKWRGKYRRRSAMLDELNRAGY